MAAGTRATGWLVRSDAQAKATLALMSRYVRRALQSHEWVWFARDVVARSGVDPRDAGAVANFVRDYVATRIRFSPDPVGIENITPPLVHLDKLQELESRGAGSYIIGDCDDAATLSAALAGALGVPATFTIRAFDWGRGPSPYQHVFTTLLPRKHSPVVCDTTRDAQNFPPKVQRDYTARV